jgi:uncharacterized membrane protein YbhN (UPF0104 family)
VSNELPSTALVVDPSPAARRKSSPLLQIIKWIVFVVVLVYVGRALLDQFRKVQWADVHFQPLQILAGMLCLLLVPLVQLVSYRTLLGAYTHAPPLRVMAVVAWIPPLGKYVPGKVASLVGAVMILRRFHIPAPVALSVVLVMDGLAVMSGLMIGAPLVQTVLHSGWILTALVISIGVICLHPAIFCRLLNFVLVKIGRQPLQKIPDLRHHLIPVVCAFSQWVLAGVALWLITDSVAYVSPAQIPRFMSIAGLGYTFSYLMLFAPAGLGAREIIFQLLMKDFVVPAALSAVAVVVMRIIQTFTELAAAMVGLLILRQLEREMPPPLFPSST